VKPTQGRKTQAITGALILGIFLVGVLTASLVHRASENARRVNPVALALLERNHQRMASARTLTGEYVTYDGVAPAPDLMRTVTRIRLMKPNFERKEARVELRQTAHGSWWAPPQSSAECEFSDGATVQTVGAHPDGKVDFVSRTEPAEARGLNLWVYGSSLFGFFNAAGESHLSRINHGASHALDFLHDEGEASVNSVPCRVITYQQTFRDNPISLLDVVLRRATWAAWRAARRRSRDRDRLRFTLWIDQTGLIRRVREAITDRSGQTSETLTEWRDVRADDKPIPLSFFALPKTRPLSATKAAKP